MRLIARCRNSYPDCDGESASVLLPYGASAREVEHALAVVGVYAPRGPETVEWGAFPGAEATIFDANGTPIVHLIEVLK